MKFDKALTVYFRTCPRTQDIIQRIVKWDSKKTVKQNAFALNIDRVAAYMMQRRFKLPAKAA